MDTRKGPTPFLFASDCGTAVTHGHTAYFSCGNDIYAYTDNKWIKLPPCKYELFSMAIIHGQLTTIGGRLGNKVTGVLLSLLQEDFEEVFPQMPTGRTQSAAVTANTHLVAAGGKESLVVEVLNFDTLQWSAANSIPEFPQMVLHGKHIYLSSNNATMFSCSVNELLMSCQPVPRVGSSNGSVWTRKANFPAQ